MELNLTKQQMFGGVWNHFIVQRNPRAVSDQMVSDLDSDYQVCRYRTPEGNKCAIGIFIPDDLYDPYWDDNTVPASCLDIIPRDVTDFATELQQTHDKAFNHDTLEDDYEYFETRLRGIAGVYGLTIPS